MYESGSGDKNNNTDIINLGGLSAQWCQVLITGLQHVGMTWGAAYFWGALLMEHDLWTHNKCGALPKVGAWCGRESRHPCWLPHSKSFSSWSLTWTHIISEGFGFYFIHFWSFISFSFSNFVFLLYPFKQQLVNLNIPHYNFPFPTAGQLGPDELTHWTVGMRGNVCESSAPVGATGCMM